MESEMNIPLGIHESLAEFRRDYPDSSKVAFVMMRFSSTSPHQAISDVISNTLKRHDLVAIRADRKQYHPDLYYNILTYIYGCDIGIVVFERIEEESYNPNISFELGYMFALRKPVCILKEQTLNTLHSDLIGKLYLPFDAFDPAETIPPILSHWLDDRGFVRISKRVIPPQVSEPLNYDVIDIADWSPEWVSTMFANALVEARNRAYRQFENTTTDPHELNRDMSSFAAELIERWLNNAGLEETFRAWKNA